MSIRVLYLEDAPDLAEIMVDYFESVGIAVDHAPDGQEGLAKLGRGGHDVVVTDITMPKVDGWEVLRQIRARPELAKLPIIVLTSHDTRLEAALGTSVLGADAYITKPFDPREVVDAVRRLGGGR